MDQTLNINTELIFIECFYKFFGNKADCLGRLPPARAEVVIGGYEWNQLN